MNTSNYIPQGYDLDDYLLWVLNLRKKKRAGVRKLKIINLLLTS